MKPLLYSLAALSMAIGVGCGAFGAHGLRDLGEGGFLSAHSQRGRPRSLDNATHDLR